MPSSGLTDGAPVDPPTPVVNRGRCCGVWVRMETQLSDPAMRALGNGFTMNWDWNVSEPSQGTINWDKLSEWHDYCEAEGFDGFRVRLFAGDVAPTFAKEVNGFTPIAWYNSDGPTDTVGPFWQQDYMDLYYEWTQQLQQVIATEYPLVQEVTDSCMTTLYSEPYIRGWSPFPLAERQGVLDAGYTYQADEAGIRQSQDRQVALWGEIGVSVVHAFNPWQRLLDDNTTVIDQPWTMGYLNYYKSLGPFAAGFNTSLGNPITVRGDNYEEMWRGLKPATEEEFPNEIQTMTLPKMKNTYPPSNPNDTCLLAASADMQCIGVEIPDGCQDDPDPTYLLTPAQAEAATALLIANAREGQYVGDTYA